MGGDNLNTLLKMWNKTVEVLPIVWGFLIVTIITLLATSIGVLLGAFILRMFGVV
jgi:hypothetical protein